MTTQGPPTVSVCVITYNHEAFVAQALDSALAQRTAFPVEVVVGEDCSTDRTAAVVADYELRHPGIVRVLPAAGRNLGVKANLIRTLLACRGPYVAILEGDDYWTDPDKLSLQVDFLDANPRYAGCAHIVRQLGGRDDGKTFPNPCPGDVTFADLLDANRFHTCSVVYRRQFPPLPDWYKRILLGDWPLHIIHAIHGPFRVLPEIMAAYRVHSGGIWSLTPDSWQVCHLRAVYEALTDGFPEHARSVARAEFRWECLVAHQAAARGDWPAARAGLSRLRRMLSLSGSVGIVRFVGTVFRVLTPPFYEAVIGDKILGIPGGRTRSHKPQGEHHT